MSNKNGNTNVILETTGYDKDGHTVYTKLGNGTETRYTYDHERERLQEMNLTSGDNSLMHNRYTYDAVDNILGISNLVDPMSNTSESRHTLSKQPQLGGSSLHNYQYDNLNRLISASGKAKNASYTLSMSYNQMSMPMMKSQQVDSSLTAVSYDMAYQYGDQRHPTAPTQIGHEHYTYDANGNPVLVENDSTSETRELYWDEDNRLMVLSDNGKTSRYTYNHSGERIVKSHGTMEGVYINGAPQGITFHETDEFTLYPASIISVNKNRFTKHYFIGSKRIASRIGSGHFNNVYGMNGCNITAGQQDYAERLNQIESQKEDYYRELGIAPGIPTMKGSYGDPENTGVGYNTIIKNLGDHSVPAEWAEYVKKNDKKETAPGAPIAWEKASQPEEVQPGYGFIPDNESEETFYYHSDHLGSTSYITDDSARITQYTAYLPYGELLVDEHSSSEDMPYKFNGKELDEETGLYYYGARYMQPISSVWYGIDPLTEKYPNVSAYAYCMGNPVKLVDVDGNEPEIKFVGIADDFIRVLNESPRKVGFFKGAEAANYLKSLSNTEWSWSQLRPLPTQTGYFNKKIGRYIYTTKGGWLDMTHFMFYAGKAYNYKLQKEAAQKILKENSSYIGESYIYIYNQANMDPITETIKDGYHQELSDRIAAKHSAYSYEDLPTDKIGAIFGAEYFDPNSKLSFGEQLYQYLMTLGATTPDQAPNYHDLPLNEVETPTRTNHSTKPVYTNDNP